MTTLQAYRYALLPTPEQERVLLRHAGARRFCYNALLDEVRANLSLIAWERRVLGVQMSEYLSWSAIGLQNHWNQILRHRVAPWYAECPDDAYRSAFYDALPGALRAWREGKAGKRPPAGFPRPQGRRTAPSVTYYHRGGKPRTAGPHHIELPRVPGPIRTDEPLTALLTAPEARVKRCTVTRSPRGRWFAAFIVERAEKRRPADARPLRHPGSRERAPVVGVALGLRELCVIASADGREIPPPVPTPRSLQAILDDLAFHQRRQSRQVRGSGHWRATGRRIAVLHERAASVRRDLLQKTTTALAQGCRVIAIPELHVRAMAMSTARAGRGRRGRHENQALYDAALFEFRRELEYKAAWYGCQVVVVPASAGWAHLCSACGARVESLDYSDPRWRCACGAELRRQHNTAINLARAASAIAGASGVPVNGLEGA